MQKLKTRIIFKTLIFAVISSLLFQALGKGLVALGILIGAFTGIGSFHLLARHVLASTSCSLQKIKPYFFLKYLVRYAIMGIVLFLCARVGLDLFFGASGGLLFIPIIAAKSTYKECKIQGK